MSSLEALEPADWAVIGAAGAGTVLALAACLYTVPWRRDASKDATRSFSVLWRGRAWLSLLAAGLSLSLLLRVSLLWGPNSLFLPASFTSWTGAGWMCRIYLTVSLGVLQPLCAFTALLMLTAALSRRHRPGDERHPSARLVGLAVLCSLPSAVAQAVVAWLGLAVQPGGQPVEAAPRSPLGIFFAAYWQGSPEQCGDGSGVGVDGSGAAAAPCAACTFPAAAVIVHAASTLAFLAALWATAARLAAAVLNTRLKRRVRTFRVWVSALSAAGVAALAVSVVRGPFSWLNAACWLAYVASVLLSAAVLVWGVAVWPVRELRAVDKRLALWADASTAALAAAGGEGGGDLAGGSGGGGGPGLIKAHNRSSDADAYVAASAVARTLSASRPPSMTGAPPRPSLALQQQAPLSPLPGAPPSPQRAPGGGTPPRASSQQWGASLLGRKTPLRLSALPEELAGPTQPAAAARPWSPGAAEPPSTAVQPLFTAAAPPAAQIAGQQLLYP